MSKSIIKPILVLTGIIIIGLTLQADGQSTKKPKSTKNSETSTLSTYRVNNTDGITCILVQTDALLVVQYRNKLGKTKEVEIYLPDYPELSGYCVDDEDESSMILKTRGFVLKISFNKTPGGENWYVSKIDLWYSSSNPEFEQIDRPGLNVKLSTKVEGLYPTPVGKSHSCDDNKPITLEPKDPYDESAQSGHSAQLYFRKLTMQSFMFRPSNKWGPEFHCSATGKYRDENANIIAGSALAIATCGSVTAYGIWRYMKIKNVQYGAME